MATIPISSLKIPVSSTNVQTPPPSAPTPPTGHWTHPKLDEIAQRQSASTFSYVNIQRAFHALVVLALLFVVPEYFPVWAAAAFPTEAQSTIRIVLPILRVFTAAQILNSLRPMLSKPDEVVDIPLTPRQRSLLGLGPASRQASPLHMYITPPRYTRSSPRISSTGDRQITSIGSSRVAAFGSPSVRSVSASPITTSNNSPFAISLSPVNGSPLARKTAERVSSVGITNKWLYQRRRDSPGSAYLST